MASDDNPCCGGLICLVIGAGLLLSGTHRFLLVQKVKNTPTSKVRSAAVGLVELSGKAKCKTEIKSPISQVICTYWRIKAEWYQPGKHGGWRDLYSAKSSEQFCLEDETGRMLIEPKDAEVDIPRDFFSQGHLSDKALFGLLPQQQLDKKVLAFLDANPDVKKRFQNYSGYDQKVEEYFIAENDPVYIIGGAEPLTGASSAVAHENLIVKKGKYENIMYISDSSENKVLSNLSGSMWWGIGLGIILFAIGLFLLIISIGIK
jgi:hypothetical protein